MIVASISQGICVYQDIPLQLYLNKTGGKVVSETNSPFNLDVYRSLDKTLSIIPLAFTVISPPFVSSWNSRYSHRRRPMSALLLPERFPGFSSF